MYSSYALRIKNSFNSILFSVSLSIIHTFFSLSFDSFKLVAKSVKATTLNSITHIVMCIQDLEQIVQEMEDYHFDDKNKDIHSDYNKASGMTSTNSFLLESIHEDTAVLHKKEDLPSSFVPTLRSGEWSDIGGRSDMEDTHICINDLAKNFGHNILSEEAISFFGVFDGHGGKDAAYFVRDHLPRVIVEDADFPLELEKIVKRSFKETDVAFAKTFSLKSALRSGTTALTAMIFGRSLLVANAGDCRAVLSRRGVAIEMSKDHRPCCNRERLRIESLGGYIDNGYLNGELGVTRALGNWHLEGMKHLDKNGGPLTAEPELKLMTLTNEDEFLIIGSDGMWDVFRSQNAVDFARRQLREHNDVKLCCKEIVEEAIKRGATDNLTMVMVSFHVEPPPPVVIPRGRIRRCISAEAVQNLKHLLQG